MRAASEFEFLLTKSPESVSEPLTSKKMNDFLNEPRIHPKSNQHTTMKNFMLFLLSSASIGNGGAGAERDEPTFFRTGMANNYDRYLQNDCPNTFTIDGEGTPNFLCSPEDCGCSSMGSEYTVRENLGSTATPCYRCAKPDGASCSNDFECNGLTAASCNNGVCGADQCPNTITGIDSEGVATSLCTTTRIDCECTVDGYTVKQDVSAIGQPPCYHCSKPNDSTCSEDHECLVFESVCSNNFCETQQCPREVIIQDDGTTSSECSFFTCVCTEDQFTLKEDLTGNGCFHCAIPDGAACSEDHECGRLSTCNNGICSNDQCPNTATIVDDVPEYDCIPENCECSIGAFNTKETLFFLGSECFRCAKPNGHTCSEDVECLSSSSCDSGICTARGGANEQCPSTTRIENDMPISSCTDNSDCICSENGFTVKEDITGSGCFHCSKPNGSLCMNDDECLFFFGPSQSGSECYDGTCSNFRCPLLSDGTCTPYDCVCEEPEFPMKTTQTVGDVVCFACTVGVPPEECGEIFETCENDDDCCEPYLCRPTGNPTSTETECTVPRVRQRPSVVGEGRGGAAGAAKGGVGVFGRGGTVR